MDLTLWLAPRAAAPRIDRASAEHLGDVPIADRSYAERERLLRESDADGAAFDALATHVERAGIERIERKWRRVVVRGTAAACSAVAREIRASRAGDAVRNVIGLSETAPIRSHARIAPAARSAGMDVATVAQSYDFPVQLDGTGTTIAILSFGGVFHRADFAAACSAMRPAATMPPVTFVHRELAPEAAVASEADAELALDTQIAAGAAPGATLSIAQGANDVGGYVEAVASALLESPRAPTVLSISYGLPESLFTTAARQELETLFAVAAYLGTTVVASSGDAGAHAAHGETPAVSYPASSPLVLACGGTTLHARNGRRVREEVWNEGTHATGGGYSTAFPGRHVPDVAAHASMAFGYRICVAGKPMLAGGTSAAAPLWAALLARYAQGIGKPLGLLTALFYAAPHAFHDVTRGHNGRYRARRGWDPCTGLGTPRGDALYAALAGKGRVGSGFTKTS